MVRILGTPLSGFVRSLVSVSALAAAAAAGPALAQNGERPPAAPPAAPATPAAPAGPEKPAAERPAPTPAKERPAAAVPAPAAPPQQQAQPAPTSAQPAPPAPAPAAPPALAAPPAAATAPPAAEAPGAAAERKSSAARRVVEGLTDETPHGPDKEAKAPECAWVGKRVLSLLARDDVDAARQFYQFYTGFHCPTAHIGNSFGCIVADSLVPEMKYLSLRIDTCWADPTAELPPMAESEAERQKQNAGQPPAAKPAEPAAGQPGAGQKK
ncbi:MAG: hypothetical protein AB7K86_21070 [Rhodospirillales bacterium]